MKQIKIMALLLVITVGCFCSTSCDKDENLNAPAELIGTWVYSAPDDLQYATITFAADGTGELYMRQGYDDYHFDTTVSFHWVGKGRFYDGWQLVVNAPDAPDGPLLETLRYDISGNRLTIYDPEDSEPVTLTRK